jgi:hypothetical protein
MTSEQKSEMVLALRRLADWMEDNDVDWASATCSFHLHGAGDMDQRLAMEDVSDSVLRLDSHSGVQWYRGNCGPIQLATFLEVEHAQR